MLNLIIPTYNRPHFLGRLLRYFRALNFPHRIIVADSSSAPHSGQNLSLIESVKDGLDVVLRPYSPDTVPILKLVDALRASEAKYLVFCADDDFIVPGTLDECVAHLEANPDYSIASGRAAAVTPPPRPSAEADGGLVSRAYAQRANELDSPCARLEKHLADYAPTFYAVHRREQLIGNFEAVRDVTVDHRFGELLPSCLSIIQGKAACLDRLYTVRQYMAGSTSGTTVFWPDMLTLDDFSDRYRKFRGRLVEELGRAGDVPEDEAVQVVNKSFRAYLSKAVSERLTNGRVGPENFTAGRRLRRVVETLPAAARAAFLRGQAFSMLRSPRKAYRRLVGGRDEMSIGALLDGRSPFREDFLPIYESFRLHPQGIEVSAVPAGGAS